MWPEVLLAVLYRTVVLPGLCSPFSFVMAALSLLAGLQWAAMALLAFLLSCVSSLNQAMVLACCIGDS